MQLESLMLRGKFKYAYFIFCLVILFLVYFSAHRAMLVDDGINGLLLLKMRGWEGFLNSYDTNCFYYSFWTFLWFLHSVCKTNTVMWFIFFAAMHALNTTLAFTVFRKIYRFYFVEIVSSRIALTGSVFFLCSPFLSENVLWTATHHYVITCFIFLWSIGFIIDAIHNPISKSRYLLFLILFTVALTTHEITFFFLFVYISLFLLFRMRDKANVSNKKFFATIIIPIVILYLIYLIALYFSRGIIVPHYYANEIQFSIPDMVSNFYKYQLKFWTHISHLENNYKEVIYKSTAHVPAASFAFLFLYGFLFYYLYRKNRHAAFLFLSLSLCSFFLLLPVSQVYFHSLFAYEGDRYLYFYSLFAFQLFSLFIFQLGRISAVIAGTAFLIVNIWFACVSAYDKTVAADYVAKYVDRFADQADKRTFIFNMPAVVREQRLFYYMDGFSQLYHLKNDVDISERVFNIVGVVCKIQNNKIEANWVNDSVLLFKLRTDGEWYTRRGDGGTTYETAQLKCETTENNDILLTIKNRQETDRVLIFEKGFFKHIAPAFPSHALHFSN